MNSQFEFLDSWIRDCNLLLTAPTVLVACTVTGWLNRIRLQKVSQLDLKKNSLLSGKAANQTLIMKDGFCCELLFEMMNKAGR